MENAKAEKFNVHANVEKDLYEAMAGAARSRGLTNTEFMKWAIVSLLDELCEPVPETARRQVAN